MTDAPPPARPVSDVGQDDSVLPYAVEALDVRGRVARLGEALNTILAQHAYPEPVARLVGEAAVLTVLLGTALKFEGRFQLQTRTDGPVEMVIVDFEAPDRLRALARFDAARVAEAMAARETGAALMGHGHLALTIDSGPDSSRYQGVVELDGEGFEEAAHRYFRQSEQIPTLVRLAVAENITGAGSNWRAGGLLAQFLPDSPERRRIADLAPGDAPAGAATPEPPPEDDAWNEAKALAATVEDHELVDPTLSSERLLYRLFHERGVRVFDAEPVRHQCRCSRERMAGMLRSFSPEERREMIGDDGLIGVTCEFCSRHHAFEPAEFDPT
jgi:molecular chaperone Hsp33